MAAEAAADPDAYDVVVVGSGFGGAVAAFRLAEGGARSVVVLERGRPWPPGSFPRTPRETAGAFWHPPSGRHGLYDAWSFSGLDAVVASGLGGGSLIYANVMLRKDEDTFVDDEHEAWPIRYADLERHYEAVERMQGATRYPVAYEPYASTPKTRAMLDGAAALGLEGELPHLAISFAAGDGPPRPGAPLPGPPNVHGAQRFTCRLCGECVVGCQYGAKNTLDFTYLSAALAHGARIRTCCEVVRLQDRGAGGWEVAYRQHLPAKAGHPQHLLDPSDRPERVVRARQVVLAAGTLGTTRLLLANRAGLPPLSPRLGSSFSSNGDVLVFVRDADRWLDPSTGPTITASVRVRDAASPSGRGFFLQDAGAPTASEWLWQTAEVLPDAWRLARTLRRRVGARLRGRRDPSLSPVLAEAMGTARTSAAMMPLLGMGRDVPDGRLTLHGERLALSWRERPSRAFFEGMEAGAEGLARALGGRLWRPGGRFGRLVSVHPLGGCPMGDERSGGVVDEYGRVRGARGLYIADGSIMPGPVGANPSLTIAALADRIAERALAE